MIIELQPIDWHTTTGADEPQACEWMSEPVVWTGSMEPVVLNVYARGD
jgi:hypothetical protein